MVGFRSYVRYFKSKSLIGRPHYFLKKNKYWSMGWVSPSGFNPRHLPPTPSSRPSPIISLWNKQLSAVLYQRDSSFFTLPLTKRSGPNACNNNIMDWRAVFSANPSDDVVSASAQFWGRDNDNMINRELFWQNSLLNHWVTAVFTRMWPRGADCPLILL